MIFQIKLNHQELKIPDIQTICLTNSLSVKIPNYGRGI